ncbi:Autoinducer 2 (AI-2) kinase LsrK [Klebsiella pneumoniae]|nr:Autoinducer 2 (AI-2) kinase LsrK [Klebsiella pneumoniae]
MISDWLAAKLSGELAVDPSNAGTTGMLDLFSRDWRPALLDMAGLRADMLSPVKETGTLLGAVTEAAAQQSGLRAGTPVVMGAATSSSAAWALGWCAPGKPRYSAALSGSRWSTCRRCVPIRR